jgi:hypothetical protein
MLKGEVESNPKDLCSWFTIDDMGSSIQQLPFQVPIPAVRYPIKK